jgi:hypothetical protein
MTIQEIKDTYNLSDMPIQNNIAYKKVLSQLPNGIEQTIGRNDIDSDTAETVLSKLQVAGSKAMYTLCVQSVKKPPDRVVHRWEIDLIHPFDDWQHKSACNYQLSMETKLQTFIFKLFHRILPTEEFLYKVGLSDTDICRLCEENIETLLHYMCSCPVIVQFWQDVVNWLENKMDIPVSLEPSILLFGTGEVSETNYVILIAKYYLYLCKHKAMFPQFDTFLSVLKEHCKLQKRIAHKPITLLEILD